MCLAKQRAVKDYQLQRAQYQVVAQIANDAYNNKGNINIDININNNIGMICL